MLSGRSEQKAQQFKWNGLEKKEESDESSERDERGMRGVSENAKWVEEFA